MNMPNVAPDEVAVGIGLTGVTASAALLIPAAIMEHQGVNDLQEAQELRYQVPELIYSGQPEAAQAASQAAADNVESGYAAVETAATLFNYGFWPAVGGSALLGIGCASLFIRSRLR